MVATMVAPPPPTTTPNPEQYHNMSKLLETLAYLEEFVNSDTDGRLNDQTPTPAVYQPPMSFHDIHALQMKVMAKLMDMIGVLHGTLDLFTAAATCPQQSPLESTMNAQMIPALWLPLSGNLPSPQQYTVFGFLKPQGSFETLRASLLRTQLAHVSHTCTYKVLSQPNPPSIAVTTH